VRPALGHQLEQRLAHAIEQDAGGVTAAAFKVFKVDQPRQALAMGARWKRAEVPWCCAMQGFVHRKNLENYRRLLAGELGDAERVQILKLLAEEKARDRPPLKAASDDQP
jgi:hypothetical protein